MILFLLAMTFFASLIVLLAVFTLLGRAWADRASSLAGRPTLPRGSRRRELRHDVYELLPDLQFVPVGVPGQSTASESARFVADPLAVDRSSRPRTGLTSSTTSWSRRLVKCRSSSPLDSSPVGCCSATVGRGLAIFADAPADLPRPQSSSSTSSSPSSTSRSPSPKS